MGNDISSYTTKILEKEIQKEIEGKYFNNIQQIDKDLFKLSFSSPKKELLIQPGKRINLTYFKFQAPKKASQISMVLRKKLKGKKLQRVYQHGADRIIIFEFNDLKLIVEFFSQDNLVLVDNDFKILFTFKKKIWKDREFKIGAIYKFPISLEKEVKKDFSPVSEEEYKKHGSINKALDEFYAPAERVNVKLLKLKKRLEKQEETLKEYGEKVKFYTIIGDKIYENYQEIEKILNSNKKELSELNVERKGKNLVLDLDSI